METLLPTGTFSLPVFSNTLDSIPIATTTISDNGFYGETLKPEDTFYNSPDRIPLIVGCVLGSFTLVFLLIALYLALKLRKRKQLLNKSIEEERMLTDNYQSSGSLSDPNSAFSVAVKRAAEIPDSPVDNTR